MGSIFWYIRNLNKKLQKEQLHNKELADLNVELSDINTANQRFVPKDFLQILGKQSIKDLHLGDQTQAQMTILFSDIRSYTTLSEKMTPQQNFNFINEYLGRVGPIIKQHGGTQYWNDPSSLSNGIFYSSGGTFEQTNYCRLNYFHTLRY